MNYGFQPSQSANVDPNSAFADALARARQVAAKIISNPSEAPAPEPVSLKRPFEGIQDFIADNQPDPKKMNSGMANPTPAAINDPIGAQLRSLMDHQRQTQAQQAAAAAASQINQKLGAIAASSSPPGMNPGSGGAPMGMNMGMGGGGGGGVMTEEITVPDRMVGLIIGKGGEQIASIQADSGCKVQFAPDSGGLPDRPVTLTGSRESIELAKDLISRIINRGGAIAPDPNSMGDGTGATIEIMIPGNKVGLVIGKGGETIRQLQERAGVKMVMVQDSNAPTYHEKPLRIMGETMRCQRAKEMVTDLITEKELESMQQTGQYGGNEYGGGNKNLKEMKVPKVAVGVIIGKGGEMIKKIQSESGARVQFNTSENPAADERTCMITGTPDKLERAASMIQELVDSTNNRQDGMGRGRGRGRGDDRGRFGNGNQFDSRPGPGRGFGGEYQDETAYPVPAEKCGLVIGKGGETIRDINQQSGAYVELQRGPSANPGEKVFTVRGNPGQIQHAIQLIAEKAGLPQGAGPGMVPGGPHGGPGGPNQGPGGPMGGPGGYGQYPQQPQQQSPYGQPQPPQQHQQPQQSQPPQQPQSYTPQGWNTAYQQWQSPTPSDPNAAAQTSAAPTAQTGQPDYSAAWAEYYRQQGMHYHAQAIMAQAQAQQQQHQQHQQPLGQ